MPRENSSCSASLQVLPAHSSWGGITHACLPQLWAGTHTPANVSVFSDSASTLCPCVPACLQLGQTASGLGAWGHCAQEQWVEAQAGGPFSPSQVSWLAPGPRTLCLGSPVPPAAAGIRVSLTKARETLLQPRGSSGSTLAFFFPGETKLIN